MKKFISALFFLLIQLVSFGQDAELIGNTEKLKDKKKDADTLQGWKTGGQGALTFSQVSLTNWAGGGENSLSLNGAFTVFAHLVKKNYRWENNLDLAYGLIKQGDAEFQKSDDRVDFYSKYGRQAFGKKQWFYAGMINFRSQMAPGYQLPNDSVKISDFMAPAYVLLALGLEYKPLPDIQFFLSPLTGKVTVVNNQSLADAGAFGVTPAIRDANGNVVVLGERIRSEFGGYFKFFYKTEIAKTATFQTKLDLFSNYANNPGNIDVNWETSLVAKVGKYISMNLGTLLIYDDDVDIQVDSNNDGVTDKIGPRVQFRQMFGVGFSYKI